MGITKTGIEAVTKGLGIVDKLTIDQDLKNSIKQAIIFAEMNSDSKYVKMARPSIIYVGLLLIILEVLGLRLAMLSWMDATEIMIKSSSAIFEYFLFTWGGIASVYALGRTYEKQKRNIVDNFQKVKRNIFGKPKEK